MKSHHHLSLLLLFTTVSAPAAVMNYVITGLASADIGGDGTDGTNVPLSGTQTQTDVATAGSSFVDFTIGDADTIVGDKFLAANINALPTVATLRVSVNAISSGSTKLMLTRTSNSQGLTDIGTLTVLLTGATQAEALSATFGFEWRNAANDSILTGSDQMVFTSYDIDYTQRNSFATGDYSTLGTSATTSLTTSTSGGTTTVYDPSPGTNSLFDNPNNAYAFQTVAGDYTQSITVDKNNGIDPVGGNQLYMFSFRSPSPLIVTIPEPSVALVGGLGLLTLLRRRR